MKSPGENAGTFISEDADFNGSLKFGRTLHVDGRLKGDITSSGVLTVGRPGNVKAQIKVGSVSVDGKIEGNIEAQDRIELRATAQIFGDIKGSRLVIEEGVTFVGHCDVNAQKLSSEGPPEAKPEPKKKEEKAKGAKQFSLE